jgi:hypothetical protein
MSTGGTHAPDSAAVVEGVANKRSMSFCSRLTSAQGS